MRLINAEPMPHGAIWESLSDREKQNVLFYLLSAPTVDAEPVQHGKWIPHADYATCSNCFDDCYADSAMEYSYCPSCGAKMDKEEEKQDEQ